MKSAVITCALLILSTAAHDQCWTDDPIINEHYKPIKLNNFKFRKNGNNYRLENVDFPVIPTSFLSNVSDIKNLFICKIGLVVISPGAFSNLPQLHRLEITRHNIQRIPDGVFSGLQLKELIIANSENPIDIAPNAFDNLRNLEYIRLASLHLDALNPEWFKNASSLKTVFIEHNPLKVIPGHAFQNLNNRLSFSFYLVFNRITTINDQAFEGIKTVQQLDLSFNKIETLNGRFLEKLDVYWLNLRFNKLQCVKREHFHNIFKANMTSVRANPWRSECLEYMRKWSRSHSNRINWM